MTMRVVPIPAVGAVGSRPRKEPIYDTEGWAPAVPQAAEIVTFVNFSSFNTAGVSLSKAFGRDTNLQGQNGLPAAHHMYWYGMRLKIRSMDADLSDVANITVSEEINRVRELSFTQFRFASSELITVQADEAPSGTGPQFINTTHPAATVFSLPSGVPTRGNAKDVTISGRPVEIVALEAFRVVIGTPAGITPTVSLYASTILEGLLLRGITG
jgi:hypothetical protein